MFPGRRDRPYLLVLLPRNVQKSARDFPVFLPALGRRSYSRSRFVFSGESPYPSFAGARANGRGKKRGNNVDFVNIPETKRLFFATPLLTYFTSILPLVLAGAKGEYTVKESTSALGGGENGRRE